MRILMVNKFFYIKGGSETYYFSLKKLLESKGHEVIDFSMRDQKNYHSEYSNYFVKNVDYSNSQGILKKITAAVNIVYSLEAKKKFEQIIVDTRPDLVHLNIFQHQISPSILDVIKKYHIPTVYTAHDLKMLCLNYKMMHHGKICEACKYGKFYNCFFNKCVKDSFLKSSVNMIEGYFHKIKKSYNAIDAIITPSEFYKNKFIEFGIEEERIYHIPNFLNELRPSIDDMKDKEKFYLYFGRLSEEKGVFTLIKAFKNLKCKLYIVGSGPIESEIRNFIIDNSLDNIDLLGFQSGQKLKNIVGNAKAIILPSEWYENGPYSAIEALQLGRPIIGSNIGGIPELVNGNGFLFQYGDYLDLKDKVLKVEALNTEQYRKLKKSSLELFNRLYTEDHYYKQLMKVYTEAYLRRNFKNKKGN